MELYDRFNLRSLGGSTRTAFSTPYIALETLVRVAEKIRSNGPLGLGASGLGS